MIAALSVALAGASAPATTSALPPNSFENPASSDTSQQFSYGAINPALPAGNPQRADTPNDPQYDQAEPDSQHRSQKSTSVFDERFDLFGFPSQLTKTALYAVGPNAGKPQISGYNAAGAWKLTRGTPAVSIAILDTGIKWGQTELRTQIHLNTGELPFPLIDPKKMIAATTMGDPAVVCASYSANAANPFDVNHDGAVNVLDYACDPRVDVAWTGRAGPSDLITGQDLIHAFGTCQVTNHVLGTCGGHFDNDHNGYANDIAGWNFFDDNNDPGDLSSYFAARNHGSGRAADAAERGNDASGSIGVCPHCQIMPIRVWDTFVADGNNFGLGIVYGADNGAQVIEGADGSLYHSAFAEAASQHAYDKGAVQTYSGDDLNTANHNYPANYGHAMLVEGTVPDTVGLGMNLPSPPSGAPPAIAGPLDALRAMFGAVAGSNAPVSTYFRGSNTTQFGGKSSISMEGPTGSINTGRASGAAGLVISAALARGTKLQPDETRAILEQTAERALGGNTGGVGVPDPAADSTLPTNEQWTSHFGWGRVNLGDAVSAAADKTRIPPQAAINAPDWYAPLTGASLQITGHAEAPHATGGNLHWKLLWAPGFGQTATNRLQLVSQGDATGPRTDFGSIDLNKVRAALASYTVPPDTGGPVFTPGGTNPFQQQFTVQLEVTGSGSSTPGIDRRVFTALADPTLRPSFPKRLGTGGEAPIRYADLNGDNVQELIVPTEDGLVHAYEPDGTELPGWPVHTQVQSSAAQHGDSPAFAKGLAMPLEPPRAPVVADLAGNGRPDVITAAGNHIYAWHSDGKPVAGFPVSADLNFCGPALESQAKDQRPKCGFLASPAVGHLEGPGRPLDIVEPGLDGHLYGFRADGTTLPGFPVQLQDHAISKNTQIAESVNDPAIGDLNGDGYDDVVVATNEEYGPSPANGTPDVNFAASLAAGGSTRVYAINGRTGAYLPGWPIAQPGIIQNVLPLVGPGNDPAIATITGKLQVITSSTGGSLMESDAAGAPTRTLQQNTYGPASNAVDKAGSLNLFEGSSVGDLLGAGTPAVVKYQATLSAAANLLLVGQNQPYNHLIGAFDGSTGAPLPAYPRITDDYQFLSSSTVAKMTPGATSNQVLAGTGLGLLHSYDGASGADTSGFPKQTGGWLFAPAAISNDGRIADITREGYLFEWNGGQATCQSQWPSFRHDPHDSGNYNHDGTPPAAPASGTLTGLSAGSYQLAFLTPGDDGFCGSAAAFVVQVDGVAADVGLGQPAAGGTSLSRTITLPAGAQKLSIQARDAAGNLGAPATFSVPGVGQTTTGGGTPTGVPPAASQQPQPASQPPGGSTPALPLLGGPPLGGSPQRSSGGACAAGNPRSTIVRRTRSRTRGHGRSSGRKPLRLGGRTIDSSCGRAAVRRVTLSIALRVKRRCRFLRSDGRFGRPSSCRRPRLLRTRLRRAQSGRAATWSFRAKRALPRGRYIASVFATDAQARRERRGARNTLRFRLR